MEEKKEIELLLRKSYSVICLLKQKNSNLDYVDVNIIENVMAELSIAINEIENKTTEE